MSLIILVYFFSPLIVVLTGLYSYKFLDKNLKLLLFYAVSGFCIEIMLWLALKLGIKNNLPGLHFYVMFEFLIWTLFYTQCLKGFIQSKYILIVLILFEVLCVVNFLFIQDLKSYPHTRTLEYSLLVIFSVLLFTKIMVEGKITNLARSPLVWINISVLVYFAGNFFYNIVFIHMLVIDRIFLRDVALVVFAAFNFLYYCGIAIGFLVQRKYPISKLADLEYEISKQN